MLATQQSLKQANIAMLRALRFPLGQAVLLKLVAQRKGGNRTAVTQISPGHAHHLQKEGGGRLGEDAIPAHRREMEPDKNPLGRVGGVPLSLQLCGPEQREGTT